MNLELLPRRLIDTVDRRVVGAFQFVDALTHLPVTVPAGVETRRMTIAGVPGDVRVPAGAIRLLQNRRGMYVVFRAPFFDAYINAFENPPIPAEAIGVNVSVTEAGPHYLPQEFQLDLPRNLDPGADDSVLEPQLVGLFRAPAAPVQDGWSVLRVRVTQAGTNPARPLPGVLVRVFRSPRGAADPPIGEGMTDWRGRALGEALVPVAGLQRFRPGAGANVIETEHTLEFETTRDSLFTGATGQLPNVPRIETGTAQGVVRTPHADLAITRPVPPVRVEAGHEYTVHLAMP
jgi:hypothetical protein